MSRREELLAWADALRWRDCCFTADGTAFQQLFERVMERLEPETFEAVAAYGNLGDRKTDGILYGNGVVYQVYSPWELKLGPTQRKIREDLAGAVEFWGNDLSSWTFVYNTRNRQAAPVDFFRVLMDCEVKYPDISFHRLSDKRLWRRIRDELGPEDRIEILGPVPEGLEGVFFPSLDMSDTELQELERSRLVLFHEGARPVDLTAALSALPPDLSFGPPVRIRPAPAEVGWPEAAAQQAYQINELIEEAGDLLSRLAVFPLSDIPLLLHFGFVLSDRLDVRLFQYQRYRKNWEWVDGAETTADLKIEGLPDTPSEEEGEICLLVSLSARVRKEQIDEFGDGSLGIVEMHVDEPSVDWLQSPGQLTALQRDFRRLLARIIAMWPNCRRIHLFYAGPAPGAIAIGQTINSRMHPPVMTYQFDGTYSRAIELSGDVLAR